MLHDVGKLILAWKLPDRLKMLLAAAAEEHRPLYEVEEQEDGFGHAEIGAYLLGLWGLPYTVVEAVALHHGPNRVPHRNFDAVAAIYVANLLAHELEEPKPDTPWEDPLEIHQEEIRELGIGENLADWRAMAAGIPALLAEAPYG
jgi:HD-like signal output (HDOD) protein